MANVRKTTKPTKPAAKKRGGKAAPEPAVRLDTPRWKKLSPDGVKRLWTMAHLDRPEVAATLERLYRQRY